MALAVVAIRRQAKVHGRQSESGRLESGYRPAHHGWLSLTLLPRNLGAWPQNAGHDHRHDEGRRGEVPHAPTVGLRAPRTVYGRSKRPPQLGPQRLGAGRHQQGLGYHSPVTVHTLRHMFGPLNGVRTALVIAAAFAALLALFLGYWLVSVMLLLGVAVHGLGWVYLYKNQPEDRPG